MNLFKFFKFMICLLLSGCGADLKPKSSKELVFEKITTIDKKFPDLPQLNVEDLETMQQLSYQLIDVREEKERAISHLPNSISLKTYRENPDLYQKQLLIPYCTIGYRSAIITREFLNSGLSAKNLRGSILAWVWNNKQLVDKDGTTHRVHVYGKEWDLLPENYHAIY